MGLADLLSNYGSLYAQALFTTWWMTAISFVSAMVLAIVVTVMRVSPIMPLRVVGDAYVQVFRNVAGVSLLVIIIYALPHLGVTIDYMPSVLITVTLIASGFGSENFMSGINTVGVGQVEAARSIGLSFGQMLRLVVIPQALRSAVLPMTNLCIAVMLSTALASQTPQNIAGNPLELTGVVSYVTTVETTGGISAFLISALGYVGTALVIGFVGNRIDRKVRVIR